MRTVSVLFAILLSGCAVGHSYVAGTMIPGRIVSLSSGIIYPMQIQLSQGSGKMTATNPTTGEYFEGTYTAVVGTRYTQYSKETFWGTETTQKAIETNTAVPASAVLVGNKGTVLNIKMLIQAGNQQRLPVGYGEAEDNKGEKYNIQF